MRAARARFARPAYLAWFGLHFLLITIVSCHETFRLIAQRLTVLRGRNEVLSGKVERVLANGLGLHLPESNPLRQVLASYLHLAGINAGYGYFAPNVPNSYQLVFDLRYSDGHIDKLLLSGRSRAERLRLGSLLDQIARTSPSFREHMIKKLGTLVWRDHPDAITVRVSLEQRVQPTINEYEHGIRETFVPACIYDFSRSQEIM